MVLATASYVIIAGCDTARNSHHAFQYSAVIFSNSRTPSAVTMPPPAIYPALTGTPHSIVNPSWRSITPHTTGHIAATSYNAVNAFSSVVFCCDTCSIVNQIVTHANRCSNPFGIPLMSCWRIPFASVAFAAFTGRCPRSIALISSASVRPRRLFWRRLMTGVC